MIVFFDVGFILLLFALFVLIIGGMAYNIVDFLNSHIVVIVIICLVIIAAEFFLSYFSRKKFRTSFFSIIYSSQFCFFAVRGIYLLGLLYSEHPIQCILLFFCYAVYGCLNALGLGLPLANLDGEDNEKNSSSRMGIGDIGLVALGIVGWIINWIVLK